MQQDNRSRPLLWEAAAQWFVEQTKENKVPILASLIFGFLTYMFAFTNKLLNHDDVSSLFEKGATIDSGRWGLEFLEFAFPSISMPWIYGVIAIVLMTVSICMILRVLSIRNKVLQVMLAGCIIASPSLISTMTYMFTVAPYAVSFLLAISAVWLMARGHKWDFCLALSCMVLSLSIYQAYIAVAASLLVLILIRNLLRGEEVAASIRKGFLYVGFLAASLGVYYLLTQIINVITGTSFSGYAAGKISFSLASLPSDVLNAYYTFLLYFYNGTRGLIPTAFSRLVHLVGIASAFILLLIWGRQQKKPQASRFLMIAVLIFLLPLAINCMHLFTDSGAVHTLVLYSFIAVYLLAAIIADICIPMLPQRPWQNTLRRVMLDVVTTCLALVIVINVYVANAAYLNMHLRYQNAYAFYTSLIADIKMMPEFSEDTELAILGYYPEPSFYKKNFRAIDQIVGTMGFVPDHYSRDRFLKYYLDFDIDFALEEETAPILESPEYAEMPCYPYYGSMQMFGDILVVKLSQ